MFHRSMTRMARFILVLIVGLGPANIGRVRRARKRGRANGLSAIPTVKSVPTGARQTVAARRSNQERAAKRLAERIRCLRARLSLQEPTPASSARRHWVASPVFLSRPGQAETDVVMASAWLASGQSAFHFQLRISGRSWPYLRMYCLCSTSLSLSCCLR